MDKEAVAVDNTPSSSSSSSSSSSGEAAPTRRSGHQGLKYQEKHKHIRGRGLISSSALGLTDGLVTNLSFPTEFSGASASMELYRFAEIAAVLACAFSLLL